MNATQTPWGVFIRCDGDRHVAVEFLLSVTKRSAVRDPFNYNGLKPTPRRGCWYNSKTSSKRASLRSAASAIILNFKSNDVCHATTIICLQSTFKILQLP